MTAAPASPPAEIVDLPKTPAAGSSGTAARSYTRPARPVVRKERPAWRFVSEGGQNIPFSETGRVAGFTPRWLKTDRSVLQF
jgi:hypothetical protein